jgi:hypothetical protein
MGASKIDAWCEIIAEKVKSVSPRAFLKVNDKACPEYIESHEVKAAVSLCTDSDGY